MYNSKLSNLIVNPFMTNDNDYDNFQYFDCYSIEYGAKDVYIAIHGEKTILRDNKGDIFVQLAGNIDKTADLLNCITGVEAIKKGSVLIINGMAWDGKKTALKLLID